MSRRDKGFTLIELMFVVLIIGLLAAIALPALLGYLAKGKAAAALSEIRGSQTAYAIIVAEGNTPTLALVGLPASTENCSTLTVTAPDAVTRAATPAIRCVIRDPGLLGAGATIQYNLTSDGEFLCRVNASFVVEHYPIGCSL